VKASLRREVAVAALSGGTGTEPVEALLRKGFGNYRDVRRNLGSCGLTAALSDLRANKAGRDYVRVALRRGATARIHLAPVRPHTNGPIGHIPLVTIIPARGAERRHMDAASAAMELAERAGTDVEAALRIVLGIERARKRCYELCEEATRWL